MAKYKVYFRKSAAKELEKISKDELQKIIQKIEDLSIDARPRGYKKLKSYDVLRVRQGKYRIIYFVNDKNMSIEIIKLGHRSKVYCSLL